MVSGNQSSPGYHWWREYVMSIYFNEVEWWNQLRESGEAVRYDVAGADSGTCYYQLTDEEFESIHPRPTLKSILVHHAGLGRSTR